MRLEGTERMRTSSHSVFSAFAPPAIFRMSGASHQFIFPMTS